MPNLFKMLFGGPKPKPKLSLGGPSLTSNEIGGLKTAVIDLALEQFAADNILTCFKEAYTHDVGGGKGVHVETLLSAIGAITGYACQYELREAFIKTGLASEQQVFWVCGLEGGGQMYAGPALIKLLLENSPSVWSLVAGAVHRCGKTDLPDIREIANHATMTMGKAEYGKIRDPQHQPLEHPIESLKRQWPGALKLLKSCQISPMRYGLTLAITAQLLIVEAQQIIDPKIAAQIVMEAATSMSKVDGQLLGFEI